MVRVKNPDEWTLLKFVLGSGDKKYVAILKNRKDGRLMKVPFGSKSFSQYHDKIGHYKELDHKDPVRRNSYLKRHANDKDYKFSSGWFSANYLW